MKKKAKIELIDAINNAFIDITAQHKSKEYTKYLNEINNELIANVDNLSTSKIKQIVMSAKINVDDSALLFMILAAITTIINNQRLSKKQKQSLAPIIAILGIYKITQPRQFVSKIYKANKGVKLSKNEKKVSVLLKAYTSDNKGLYAKTKIAMEKQLIHSQRLTSTSKGKAMLKELKVMRKEKQSIASMEKQLRKKFSKFDAERVINTELHSQAEIAKQLHAENVGLTHKTWKTQGDSRVRDTKWHNQVKNKRIPINSDFRAGGLRAGYPGDTRLPPSDRIFCRCYLIYD